MAPLVVESSTQMRALGVGINLLPHAVRELTELGLARSLAATGIPTAELVYHDRWGNRIWREPRGCDAGYRWPQYSIHRGELQMLLLDAVRSRLGRGAVRCGHVLEGFDETTTAVRAHLRDRRTGTRTTVEADALIGADGIRSTVRGQLHPDEGPPIGNGIRMWRGVVETKPFLSGRTMIMAGSNTAAKFVAYPIAAEAQQHGRSLVNWVAEVCLPDSPQLERGDWNRQGRHCDVVPHFAGWTFSWLNIPELIVNTARIFEYPMVDRDPLPSWGTGRVTLLGDAAHPMYPIGSNGASQAIIDARVLAFELARTADPITALTAYERARREPTNALVLANRALGPERVMRLVAERAPNGFTRIEDVMTAAELAAIAGDYKKTAYFDVDTLNGRPSLDQVGHHARCWPKKLSVRRQESAAASGS
jgi:2-polyprenyl-6-methoxyphenol hydroxylase-like FAD-dependent oxidoreductase